MNFAAWIQKYIDDSHITQLKLARDLGVSPPTISRWANGSVLPDKPQQDRLVEYFGVERSFLRSLMGELDTPHTYTPEIAAAMQMVDQKLEKIKDPKKRALAVDVFAGMLMLFDRFTEGLDELGDEQPGDTP